MDSLSQTAQGGQVRVIDVAGLQHWQATPELLRALNKGDRLLVRREPQNKYDANAISVWLPYQNGPALQAGYVPRSDAKILAPLLDAGCHVAASLVLVAPGLKGLESWVVRVRIVLGGRPAEAANGAQ
jgi:hypothetical protein